MPYTRTWDETTPAGTRAANQIDDAIRELKVDLRERMNALFVDFTVDPVVPKSAFGGPGTGLTFVIGPAGLKSANDEDDVFTDGQHVNGDSGKHQYQTLQIMPVGITITLVEFLMDKNGAVSCTAELKRHQFSAAPAAPTSITGAITRTVAGVGIQASGVLSYLTLVDDLWFVDFYGPVASTPQYYGMRVTYSRS